ncbi:MAG: DAHL domain-containing protein [Casimicrobiaceae bacterium]
MIIPKPIRVLIGGVVVAALVGVLVLLFMKTRSVDAERKTEVETFLRELKQLDAEWNVDVLKSRMEINKNYDPLTSPLPALVELQRKLGSHARAIRQPETGGAYGELTRVVDHKVDLVDQFKTENAILKNSLRYVPTAVDELSAQLRAARPDAPLVRSLNDLDTRANQILNEVLKYNLLPDAATADSIEAMLAAIERRRAAYPEHIGDSVVNLVSHTRIILRQRVVENDLLNALSVVPMTQAIDRLGEVFDRDFQAALAQSNQYRDYLLVYSGLLLMLLGYIGSRLFASYRVIARVNRELRQANETLERRVRERTAELSKAVNDLKESEAQLVQSEKMASLGQMVASIAHEINTPLAYLRSSLETVEAHVSGFIGDIVHAMSGLVAAMRSGRASEASVAEKFQETAALIDSLAEYDVMQELRGLLKDGVYGVDQIREIVVNLKNFSRLDRSHLARCSVESCLESTLQLAKSVIKSKVVNKSFGATLPVWCSPSQINQVFLNLLTNAAQATSDEHGVISIATRMHGADKVAVEITDNGVGIAEDILPKIFEPFFTTKPVGEGTGLGLCIAYKILEEHEGDVKVRSHVGVGTTFTVILPVGRNDESVDSDRVSRGEPMALAA